MPARPPETTPPAKRRPITIESVRSGMASAPPPKTEAYVPAGPLTLDQLDPPVLLALKALFDKQGQGIAVYDVTKLTPLYEQAILVTGLSSVQCDVLMKAVDELLRPTKVRPLSIEGSGNSEWILMDYRDFVIHILSPAKRGYYHLETLWEDAPLLEPLEAEVLNRLADLDAQAA